MKNIYVTLAICLCMGPIFSISVDAYDSYVISGTVRKQNGDPQPYAYVTFTNINTSETKSTQASGNGHYSINLESFDSGWQYNNSIQIYAHSASGESYPLNYLIYAGTHSVSIDPRYKSTFSGANIDDVCDLSLHHRTKANENYDWTIIDGGSTTFDNGPVYVQVTFFVSDFGDDIDDNRQATVDISFELQINCGSHPGQIERWGHDSYTLHHNEAYNYDPDLNAQIPENWKNDQLSISYHTYCNWVYGGFANNWSDCQSYHQTYSW